MNDDIGYQALTQAAMRGVMREALKVAASDAGLPGDHHFYITFRTRAPGVKLSEHLLKRFPDEMVIVIQHQFWDLEVSNRHFEVVLQFSGVPQHLEIPYSAVTRFQDPSVEFGMAFQPLTGQDNSAMDLVDDSEPQLAEPETLEEASDETTGDDASDDSRPASDGTVVRLDTFRRK